jgi:hypothetical protein
MTIPRLKTGGTLAKVINEIIDYLPRLRVQQTPQVRVDQTPRGQVLRIVAENTGGGSPIERPHPFQVTSQGGGSDQVAVYYGTVGGVEAFDFPTKTLTASESCRVVVEWLLEVSEFTAGGVSQVDVYIEPSTEPLAITMVEGVGIRYKALIATINIVNNQVTVLQHVIGHIPGKI